MAGLRFTELKSHPLEFLDFTSVTLDEFQQLVLPFETAFQARMAAWRMDGKPRTQGFPHGRSEALAPGQPLTHSPPPSCAACPGHALPRHAWRRAAFVGPRGRRGELPAPRAGRGCRRRWARGQRWPRRGKMPFKLLIRTCHRSDPSV